MSSWASLPPIQAEPPTHRRLYEPLLLQVVSDDVGGTA